jgi:phage gp36-like protein
MSYLSPYNTAKEIRVRTGIKDNPNFNDSKINTQITIADSMVEGYIIDKYILPLSSTCSTVKELAGEMACALILREQYGPEVADTDKDGQAKFDNVISILEKIQSGDLKLITDSNPKTEFTRNSSNLSDSYPDNQSDVLVSTASTAPQMRMGDRY